MLSYRGAQHHDPRKGIKPLPLKIDKIVHLFLADIPPIFTAGSYVLPSTTTLRSPHPDILDRPTLDIPCLTIFVRQKC